METEPPSVAALCVAPRSVYKSLAGVECYDHRRDARTFAGGMPVVCHPPCRAWSLRLRNQAKPVEGERELAFFCVEQVRRFGGVLEHPAYSKLWETLGLPEPESPPRDGLRTIAVRQAWFGDPRPKQTWLLLSTLAPVPDPPFALIGRGRGGEHWRRMSVAKRAATPRAMAEWLVAFARACGKSLAGAVIPDDIVQSGINGVGGSGAIRCPVAD